ncbi:efflux RND transporter periplasmic adaptor subunit [Luteimonas granuli]|uniref:Efflux RND transporter periplasmic adaptor subunit n=1 Tax=Luteimonas granuli TaxID=1176533 RepID=A0A518N5C1_9GAMM|nr:efflux RND transporter periplasmic adaptor subunit [Luteimonas granuli]QDW67120.1 efflux RND transporter periplasmic adaptor subunit [Luteimonas granuli]
MTFPRRLRYAVAAAVVLVLLAVALWPDAREVDTATVDRGAVRATLEAEGRTRLRDRYVIAAPVSASVRRIRFEPGDTVAAGEVVAVLDAAAPAPLDARTRAALEAWVAGARSTLAAAREEAGAAAAAARQADAEADRLETLVRDRLVAVETAEQAGTGRQRAAREAEAARHRQSTAEYQLRSAEAMLARGLGGGAMELELASPVDGVLLRRHFESARPVQAGEPLFEVGDPSALEVEVDVLSADAVRLREGMEVELLRWGGEPPLHGRVRRIEPGGFTKVSALGVEEQRVWVVVELAGAPEEHRQLGDAYRINARFVLEAHDDTVRVPGGAIFRHGEGHAVFAIDGRRSRLRPVRTGLAGSGWVEVLEGLSPGERVVVHPDNALADGDRVDAR